MYNFLPFPPWLAVWAHHSIRGKWVAAAAEKRQQQDTTPSIGTINMKTCSCVECIRVVHFGRNWYGGQCRGMEGVCQGDQTRVCGCISVSFVRLPFRHCAGVVGNMLEKSKISVKFGGKKHSWPLRTACAPVIMGTTAAA